MRKIKFTLKTVFTFGLLLLMIVVCGKTENVKADTSGMIGDNIYWTFDNGVLTVSGQGKMMSLEWSGNHRFEHGGKIPWADFYDDITKVVVEDGVTTIYKWTFSELDYLSEVIIADSVETIEESAFRSCDRLKTISMPATASIDSMAFYYDKSIESIKLTGKGSMIDFYTNDNNKTSQASYYQNSPWYVANSNDREVTVEISDGIERIGDYAFYGCSNLKKVIIPESVKDIGRGAFSGCNKTTGIIIPDGITSIGSETFNNCEGIIGKVVIPESVSIIGDYAFNGCSGITELSLPASAKLGKYSFDNMKKLTKVKLTGKGEMQNYCTITYDTYDTYYEYTPWYSASKAIKNAGSDASIEVEIGEGVTSIGKFAFNNCEYLSKITMPSTIKNIGEYAFNNCKRLSGNIFIPTDMTEIGNYTFNNCESLRGELVIPDSIKKIGDYAFYNCSRLEKIVMPATALIKTDAFANMKSLKNVKLTGKGNMIGFSNNSNRPVNVSYYDDSPWYSSSCYENEVEVEISSGITSISDYAFYNCRYLSKLVIPDTVEEIGNYAFVNNDLLSSIEFGGSEKDWKNISVGENSNLDSIKIVYNSKQSKGDSSSGEAKLSTSKKSMSVGEKFELSLENVSGKTTWKSSNSKVITVDNGTVTAVGSGTATVTATNNGTKYKCKITVEGAAGLNHTTATMKVGESLKLKVSGTKAVSFTSSKKSVAKVKASGTVVAKKAGTTTIKVKCGNGQTYTCKVTVKK